MMPQPPPPLAGPHPLPHPHLLKGRFVEKPAVSLHTLHYYTSTRCITIPAHAALLYQHTLHYYTSTCRITIPAHAACPEPLHKYTNKSLLQCVLCNIYFLLAGNLWLGLAAAGGGWSHILSQRVQPPPRGGGSLVKSVCKCVYVHFVYM